MTPDLLYRGHPAGLDLEHLAARLSVLSPESGRWLALQVVAYLISVFQYLPEGMRMAALLLDAKNTHSEPLSEDATPWRVIRKSADVIGSGLHARMFGRSGSAPAQRVPEHPAYVIAETLRRACEDDVTLVLPLLVHDARELLVWAHVETDGFDHLLDGVADGVAQAA